MGEHFQLVNTIITIAGFIVGLVGFAIKTSNDTNMKIEEAQKQDDEKRARIYERLDDVKKKHDADIDRIRQEAKEDFVNVKICKILHDNTDRIFTEIKTELVGIKESLCILADKINSK